jgi:hypothetical protein
VGKVDLLWITKKREVPKSAGMIRCGSKRLASSAFRTMSTTHHSPAEARIALVCAGLFCLACLLNGQTATLSFEPFQAAYSQPLDSIVMISGSPNQLHIYNANTNVDSIVLLPSAPLSLSVSRDGLHAAVAHANVVSYVNLQTKLVEKSLTTNVPSGVVVLGDSAVYVFGGMWGAASAQVDLSSGSIVTYSDWGSTGARLHPTRSYIYATQGEDPNTVVRWDVSGNIGGFPAEPPIGFWGALPQCGAIWFSPAGDRIYNGCASVMQSSADTTVDLTYLTTFAGLSQIQSMDTSAALSEVAVIPMTSSFYNPNPPATAPNDSEVRLFDAAYLNPVGRFALPPFLVNGGSYAAHGHWVFFNQNSSSLIVVMQADGTAGLTHDFAVQTYPLGPVNSCDASFADSNAIVLAAGSYVQEQITAGAGCTYSVQSNVDWIVPATDYYGSGPNTLTYLVRPNLSAQSRSGILTMGTQTLTVNQEGTTPTASFTALSMDPVAAVYSKALDQMLLASASPNELHIFDPVSLSDQTIALPAAPFSVGVQPDGTHAAVGHDGWVSYINLQTNVVEQVAPIGIGPATSIVIPGNGYIYAAGGSSEATWPGGAYVQLSSGPPPTTGLFGASAPLLLHPSGQYIYATAYYGDTNKWDISSGVPVSVQTSNVNALCAPFWSSEDGTRIYSACGQVFHSSDIPSLDLTPNGNLSESSAIVWIADAGSLGDVAVLSAPSRASSSIQLYAENGLSLLSQGTLAPFTGVSGTAQAIGKYLFWNAAESKMLVVAEADSTSSLLSDFGVYTVDPLLGLSACTYAVSPSTLYPGPNAANMSVNVVTPCSWIETTSDSFIDINPSPAPSVGNGPAAIYLQTNTANAARTGHVMIGNQSVTVIQQAANCTYALSSTQAVGNVSAFAGSVQLTTPPGCSWSAISNSPWIAVTNGSGTGSAMISYSVASNTTSTDRYGSISVAGSATLSVTQAGPVGQTIAFGPLSIRALGTPPFTVSAMASSGLPVSFDAVIEGRFRSGTVCEVSGATVTLAAVGPCTIEATQAGNVDYLAAPPVEQSFQVTQGSQTIDFAPLSNQPLATPPLLINATASSGLGVSFASTTETVCTVTSRSLRAGRRTVNYVTLREAGQCTIEASQAGNANYLPATPVAQSFQVTP